MNMEKFIRKSISGISVIALVLILGGPIVASAATTPTLGTATTFGVLGSTYSNSSGSTVINGDLGYITAPAVNPTVSGTTYVGGGIFSTAGAGQAAALANLNGQGCTFTFVASSRF